MHLLSLRPKMMMRTYQDRIARWLALLSAATVAASCVQEPTNEPQSSALPLYQYGSVIRFGVAGESHRFRTTGWSEPEEHQTWSEGPSASLAISAPPANAPLLLTMRLSAFIAPPQLPAQPVDVYVQGEKVASWQVAEEADHTATIPEPLTRSGLLKIDLHIPKAIAPAELTPGADTRRLGIACIELKLEPVSSTGAPE